jgi:tetratricopeptide (TPR) repeat protein
MKKFKRLDLAAVQRPANEVLDSALGWLDAHKAGPFFTWIHFYDAHSPYEPPEPFSSEFRAGGLAGLYDGEIAFADQQVGRAMAWVEQAGLAGNTIVVIVGDHGESLGSHGEGTHGFFIYDSTLHVPFIVAAPFKPLSGVRVESQVSLVDVFPTVLALAGFETAGKVHGRSLLPLMLHPEPKEQAYADTNAFAYGESMSPNLQYGWGALHSLRTPRYKFIQAPRPELYDLVTDPGETANIIDQHRAVARDMADVLERMMTDTSRDAPAPEAANLDKDTIARLAALGYVSTPVAPKKSATASAPLADPKDKLMVFASVQRAGELMGKDDYAGAVQDLETALKAEPGMPQALVMLGSCYSELGRTKDAKAQFDLVLKNDPDSIQGLTGLASILLQEGQTDDVIALALKTLSLDSGSTQAYTLLGDAYIDRHEPAKALPYLEKAVTIQPKLTQNRLNLAACLIDMKELPRAETLLNEIVASTPKFPGAQFNRGVLYDEQGRADDARTAYAAEIANYPESFKARFNLGKSLARLGDWPGSNAEMREVIRIAPQRPEGYLFLARGLVRESGPLDEIQSLAEKGLALAHASDLKALGWFLMADVFSRRHQPDKVDAALRNARMFERKGSRNDMQN